MADIETENGSEVKTEVKTEEVSKAQPDQVTNGEVEDADVTSQKNQENGVTSKYQGNENYIMYLSKKLNPKAAEKLCELCEILTLSNEDFDERAVELLATFSADQANYIVDQLLESQMYGVQNKPQYLMSVMRNFKERVRSLGSQQAMNMPLIPGPKVESIKSIIERTGYQLEVTVGQRKFHNPPDGDGQDHSANSESSGACIYIGQIPRDTFEDGLIPVFEKIGKIYDLRLMMDPQNGKSRGYAFLIYFDKAHAAEAAKQYDGFEIQPGKALKVNVSVANTRLFIGNIPKSKSRDEILEELKKHAEGVSDVIIYANPDGTDARKNRGFCFVDFNDHKAASDAKRRISQGKVRPWNNDLVVDWAEQQDEPDEETMATVKVLYVKNVKEVVTEETLKELFEKNGEVERAKKIRDYAFIHFKERAGALAAMEAMKGTMLEGVELDISLAKPQGDMKQKKKLALKRGGPMPGYGAGPMGGRGGRGAGSYQPDPYYPAGAMGGRRGGAYGGSKYGQQPPQYAGYYPQDNYGGYGGGPASYGGGPAGYGGGYDMGYAAGGYAPDPYYGGGSYGTPTPARGGGGYARGGGGQGGRGGGRGAGYGVGAGGRAGGRGTGFRGNRGAGFRGGAKRPGGDFGGPNPKRGGGPRNDDFAADIGPMNMF